MWRIFTCGVICYVEKFVQFHELLALTCQVKLFDNIILPWNHFFDGIFAVLLQNLFCCNLCCFVAKPILSRFTHFLCGDKLQPKCCPWRVNDKYHVWPHHTANCGFGGKYITFGEKMGGLLGGGTIVSGGNEDDPQWRWRRWWTKYFLKFGAKRLVSQCWRRLNKT